MTPQTERIYGWFDSADQHPDQPTFTPSFPGICLFCGELMSPADVRSHALMPFPYKRSYFYRTHRTCHEAATEQQRRDIDRVVLDSISHNGD
jgi:hypothetical protein